MTDRLDVGLRQCGMCGEEERSQIPNITRETDPLPRVFGPSSSQGVSQSPTSGEATRFPLPKTTLRNDSETRESPFRRVRRKIVWRGTERYFRRDFRNRLFKIWLSLKFRSGYDLLIYRESSVAAVWILLLLLLFR